MDSGPPEIPTIPMGPVNMSHKTEKLLICPYNKAHSILSYRMQTHLHKCRKQHPGLEWGYCSHNGTHHMPLMELEYHQTYACPDRHSFQAMVCTMEPESAPLAPVENIHIPEPEENWDDGVVNTFDPQKNAEEKSLFRGKHCVPPSERKAFRIQHRRAVQERLEDQEQFHQNPRRKQKEESAHEPASNLEPLRPPLTLPKGFLGRGAKMYTEEAPRSPGMVQSSSNLEADRACASVGATQKIQWSGMGRGKVIIADDVIFEPPTSSPAPAGAWGQGRPKF